MTGSRVSYALLPLLASVVLVGLPVAAEAQSTGGPIRLSPPRPLVTTPQPAAPEEPPAVAPRQLPNVPGVSVQDLGRVGGEAVGTLGPRQGGLGVALWAGSDRALVERLMPRLPARSQSRAVRDLTRRLLLTAATPPEGEGDQNFVALRAERLLAMGELDGASQLIGNTPPQQRDDALLMVGVQSDLLRYDLNNVCAEVDSNPSVLSVFWQQATIFCRVLAGDESEATLGLDLLREQGLNDPLYFELVDHLITETEPGDVTGASTPLNLALLRSARAQIPSSVLGDADPGLLRAIATSPNASDDIRLQAGLAAHRVGALDNGPVAELLAAHVEAAENSQLASIAELILAAARETVPTAKAAALQRGLTAAGEAGIYPVFARLAGTSFEDLSPSADIAWAGPMAVRTLLLSNRADAALAWYRVVRSEGRFDPDLAAAARELWPLLRLAHAGALPPTSTAPEADPGDETAARLGIDEPQIAEATIGPALRATTDTTPGRVAVIEQLVTPAAEPAATQDLFPYNGGDLDNWLALRTPAAPATLALLDAFGDPLDPSVWAAVAGVDPEGTVQPVDSTLWLAVREAAAAGRLGETILLSLVLLGDGDLGQASPLALHGAVGALRTVGLLDEARYLAVEAALAAGA